jgi:hypothetical protein
MWIFLIHAVDISPNQSIGLHYYQIFNGSCANTYQVLVDALSKQTFITCPAFPWRALFDICGTNVVTTIDYTLEQI